MSLRASMPFLLLVALTTTLRGETPDGKTWQAGVARVNVTPTKSMWLSGYGARDRPAEGKLADLWAKALVLVDPAGNRAVLVTMDLIGIDRDLSQRVCSEITKKHGIDRARIALCTSHTHTGPVVGENLRLMYFYDERQQSLIREYTADLEKELSAVVDEAATKLAPVALCWGQGKAEFAVNRRNNPEAQVPALREQGKLRGPVDHDAPVLAVYAAGESKPPLAVVFGYACHATVLSSYEWSGDWPGFAQQEIERRLPGTTAMFVAGCGGDQNPLPRRSVELAKKYGAEMADAVVAVIGKESDVKERNDKMNPIAGGLTCTYQEIDLPLAKVPTREELEQTAGSSNRIDAACAKLLLAQLDRGEKIAATYPYPIQTWRFAGGKQDGKQDGEATQSRGLSVVVLGGEVVVDYALRIKAELPHENVWVAAYANDVVAYIPSRRILQEGGYEGIGAQAEYGFLSPWSPDAEQHIIDEVRRQAGK
ncbi:MAG: neutral/alkaline non-lysosomal ceramidase N-terminal domain-containing protein [Pirellulales bacterium]